MNGNNKMKNLKIAAAATGLLVVMALLWALQGKAPHDFAGKCDLCHVGLKDPSILTRDPNHLCIGCHPDSVERSHPSGFIPGKRLPGQFPLFKGKMVCVTCHFPHQSYEAKPENPGLQMAEPGPYLLRANAAGKVFCHACHQGNFVSEEIDSHAISFKNAHAKPMDYSDKDFIDDNSRECLSCHDGIFSSAPETELGGLNWEHGKGIGLSHPVGVDYESVQLSKPGEYHPRQRLDPRLTLVNGKIGCETCHNHYSKKFKHLVMENSGSRLCLSCHNL
jgi:predicted CXXCH cytochrome family protein